MTADDARAGLDARLLVQCADATTDLVVLTEPDGGLLYLNPHARRVLGLQPQESLDGLSLNDYTPPAALHTLQTDAYPTAARESSWTGEVELQSRAGRVFPASMVLVYHARESPSAGRYSAMLRDTSEARAREARLTRQRQALLRLATNAAVTLGDLHGALRAIAAEMARCLQTARAGVWFLSDDQRTLVCQDLHESGVEQPPLPSELTAASYPRYFAALLEQRSVSADDARSHPDTREFTDDYLIPLGITSMLDAPIRLEGRLLGVVCCEHVGPVRTWHDDEQTFAASVADLVALSLANSERREALEQRRRLEAGIQRAQRLEALGVLAGGVAHDFNNLLQVMISQQGLALELLPPGRARDAVEAAQDVARNAGELCRQLLAYANHRPPDTPRVSIDDVIRDLKPLLEASAGTHARLTFDLQADRSAALDKGQLQQIVLNLVVNATEASGGRLGSGAGAEAHVQIRTRVREPSPPVGAGDLAPARVELVVSDDGVGMPPELLARIFDSFVSTKGDDRGLGLTSVQGIVRAAGGEIHVESTPGSGSTFRVLLPAAHPPAAHQPAPTRSPASLRPGTRLLLVDDQATVRTAGQRLLEHLGHHVECAQDGLEALDVFDRSAEGFDAVLLDLAMPRLGGVETLRELRERDPQVRAVILTGYGDDQIDSDSLDAPVLHKPYEIGELERLLASLLADGG